jgi:endo-1,4-beta-xylanase
LQSWLVERRYISFTPGPSDRCSRVPAIFPGEGYANMYIEDYPAKAAHEALRRDLKLAAGVRPRHR